MLGSQPDSQRLGKDCGTVTILISASRRRATVLSHVPVEDRTQPNRDLFPVPGMTTWPEATPTARSSGVIFAD
jgi:hypothetical protein